MSAISRSPRSSAKTPLVIVSAPTDMSRSTPKGSQLRVSNCHKKHKKPTTPFSCFFAFFVADYFTGIPGGGRKNLWNRTAVVVCSHPAPKLRKLFDNLQRLNTPPSPPQPGPHSVAKPNDVFSNIIAARRPRSPKTSCFPASRQKSQGRSSEYWNKKSSRAARVQNSQDSTERHHFVRPSLRLLRRSRLLLLRRLLLLLFPLGLLLPPTASTARRPESREEQPGKRILPLGRHLSQSFDRLLQAPVS